MGNKLVVAINGESQVEYDRDKTLPPHHQEYLERMDVQMDEGIPLDGEQIPAPDPMQRCRFVAAQLIDAIRGENEGLAAALLAYLANRLPELKQVRAVAREDDLKVDLVFDREFVPEVPVQFVKPEILGLKRH